MDEAIQRRVLAAVDRSEVWAIVQRLARGVDRWDEDLIRSCYFEDAVDDHGEGFVGSVDGLIEYAREIARDFVSTQHLLGNHHCEFDGDDAFAETYFLCLAVCREAPHLASAGRYVDHFRRRGGEWRIATRVVIMENNYELADSSLYPIIPAPLMRGEVQPAARDRSDVSYQRPPRARAAREAWRIGRTPGKPAAASFPTSN